MPYTVVFITALVLTNVFRMNVVLAALISVIGWGIVGALIGLVSGGGGPKSEDAPAATPTDEQLKN